MREKTLYYAEPWIDDEDIKKVIEVLKKGYISSLPEVKEFEKNVAEYVCARYAVAFSNGTAALHACMFVNDIKPGDEVITTPMTFAASANCILYCGGKPVFADIKKDTYNIDPECVKKKITSKTKAIIPVHYTGQPANIDEISEIANDENISVVEDACHAIGAKYKGKHIGSISPLNVFSFHPVKQITTGEGGMITTNSKEISEKLKQFRAHGITRDRKKIINKRDGDWLSDQQYLGYNYKFTDLQAALGVAQLKKLDKFLTLRKKYAKIYNEELGNIDEVIIPYQSPDVKSSWHLYVLKLNLKRTGKNRKYVFNELKEKYNIWAAVHYVPVYYHSYYQNLGYKKGLCPVAENHYENIITLPLFPKMTEEDVKYVIDGVKNICEN